MTTPAGWYDDGSGRQRWWDGTQWTEHFAPEAEATSDPEPAAVAPETPSSEEPVVEPAPEPVVEPAAEPITPAAEPVVPAAEPVVEPGSYAPPVPPYAAAAPAAAPAYGYPPAGAPAPSTPGYAAPSGYPAPVHQASAYQAPAGYGAPGQAPGAAAGAPSTSPSIVGWIALGASALGFILACIPPAMLFGWILLSAGFILSIVAFFLRGAKWAAIAGLALAVVGTIVGLVVFFLFVANTVQEIATGDDTSITDGETTAPDEEADEQDTTDDEAATGTDGSRENPLPLGTVISGSEYDVVVNSVTLHATDAVVAENMFNDPPADGFEYIVVNVTVTYTGSDSGYASMASVDYVTSTGEVVTSYDSFVVGPEPTLGLDELYNGGTSTGNVVLSIPIDDAGLLRITPGILDDEVFVELQ